MDFKQEFFGSELALPRLIEWFNNRPDAQRVVLPGELYIIRVKVLQNASGEPVFVVGEDPTLEDETRKFVGESVYMWVGGAGTALTATETTFFELSKFITTTGTLNVSGFDGTIFVEGVAAELKRMGYFVTSEGSKWTTGINGDGVPEETDSYSAEIYDAAISGVTDIAVGDGFTVARKTDGTVWAWGVNPDVPLNFADPVHVPITDKPVRRVAAFHDYFIMLLAEGTIVAVGNTAGLPPHFNDAPSGMNVNVTDYSGVKDIKAHTRRIEPEGEGGDTQYEQLLYLLFEDGRIGVWGSIANYDGSDWYNQITMVTDMNSSPVENAVDVVGAGQIAVALTEDGQLAMWGEHAELYAYDPQLGPFSSVEVCSDGTMGVITKEGVALFNYLTGENQTSGWVEFEEPVTATAVSVSAGQTHLLFSFSSGEVRGVDATFLNGDRTNSSLYTWTETQMFDSPPVQIFAGADMSCALGSDGELTWWGGRSLH